MRRLVYRKTQGPITEFNPSTKFEYTNQIYENGIWKFYNRYIGKFGARPIVWYYSKEMAEQFAPTDHTESKSVEWDGIDDEAYKNVYAPYRNDERK